LLDNILAALLCTATLPVTAAETKTGAENPRDAILNGSKSRMAFLEPGSL